MIRLHVFAIVAVVAVVALVAACSSSAPCTPEQLVDCPGCGSGELRRAITFTPDTDVIAPVQFADGRFVCPTCAEIWSTTSDDVSADAAINIGARTEIGAAAGAPDGTLYLIADQAPPPPPPGDDGGDDQPPATNFTLLALDTDYHTQWTTPLAGPLGLIAAPEGPYVIATDSLWDTHVTSIDAATGALRWQSALTYAQVTPDGLGGLYVVSSTPTDSLGTVTAQVALYDATGTPGHMHAMTITSELVGYPPEIIVNSLAATSDGGLLVLAEVSGRTLDFGDRTLTPSSVPVGDDWSFLAEFDPTGATKWAQVAALGGTSIAASGDLVVVAGEYQGDGSSLGLGAAQGIDAFVATYSATAFVSAVQLSGSGTQHPYGVQVAPDGSAWLTLLNGIDTDSGETTGLTIGSNTFSNGDQPQTYFLQLGL